jgi:hypothetical protein
MKLLFRIWPIAITDQFCKYPRKAGFVKIKDTRGYFPHNEDTVYMSSTIGPPQLMAEFFNLYTLKKL